MTNGATGDARLDLALAPARQGGRHAVAGSGSLDDGAHAEAPSGCRGLFEAPREPER